MITLVWVWLSVVLGVPLLLGLAACWGAEEADTGSEDAP